MAVKRWNGTGWDIYAGNDLSGLSRSTFVAKGDLLVATAASTPTRLPAGTDGQVLLVDSTSSAGVKWAAAPADATKVPLSTVTAAGDLIIGSGSGAVARLALGTTGQAPISNGTTVVWGLPTPATHVSTHGAGSSDELKGRLSINPQVGTTYTIGIADEGLQHLLTLNNSNAITLTVPYSQNVSFPLGSQVAIAQVGTGQVTVAAGDSHVSIVSTPGLKLRAQGSAAVLINIGTDSWLLVGDTSA